jgi:UDP-N-acetylmuramoyl-L-alanyl-D-glutamate--2,6-diaminopimelate ligase
MHVRLDTITEALDRAGLLADRRGTLPDTITGITDDSRAVRPGALFVAVKGTERDGHAFLAAAAEAGASVAIVERAETTSLPALVVKDGRRAAALAAAAAYEWPARALRTVAVTGTSGKTTVASMLRHLLDVPGAPSASVGTLGVLIGTDGHPMNGGSGLTTPGPVELQRVLRALVDQGVRSVALEVSSHSLDQRRVEGVDFDAAVFTNLSRDHLDYHKSMDQYLAAKVRLLDHLRPHGVIVVNLDDTTWSALRSERRRVSYSARVATAEVHAEDVRFGPRGSEWALVLGGDRRDIRLPLIGDFNVSNALAAAAAAWAVGVPPSTIADRLATIPQVPGRLELLRERPTVLRDYSHKPDALLRALHAVRPFAKGRLIVAFGCGGDRDKGKRPEMGAIAEANADWVILTSDNPRTEDPERILDDIEAGMSGRNHERIEDRRRAIEHALEMVGEDDVVMLAGKGHETYQIRGTTKQHFDEKEIVEELASGGRRAASGA